MPLQQVIGDVGTSAGPSWTTFNGDQTWLAWKGEGWDTRVWVASTSSLQPDPTAGAYVFGPQQNVAGLSTGASPAITTLNGTLYLFFVGEADGVIHWATSPDGLNWTNNGPLGLGAFIDKADNDKRAATTLAPAVAQANGLIYLFWTGSSDGAIYWSASDGGDWALQTQVTMTSGTPLTDAAPAVAASSGVVQLIWKGQGDGAIWQAANARQSGAPADWIPDGPWSAPSQIFSGAVAAPVIICDNDDVFWLAWTGAGGAIWYSCQSSGQWLAPLVRAGVASSDRPTLIDPAGAAAGMMMAWKGEGNDPTIYYGAFVGPLPANTGSTALLVIAPAAFMAQVQPLIAHKNGAGMPAVAASVESITGFFPGADAAEQVKRAIAFAHQTLNTGLVFLVGDAANVPVRMWFSHGATVTYPDNGPPIDCAPAGGFVQSDLYYASLYHHTGTYPNMVSGAFDTWDANGDGLFNEAWMGNTPVGPANRALDTAMNPDNVDGYPDVAVGRIPARDAADVAAYVGKVIAYEARRAPASLTFSFVADQPYGDFGASTDLGAIVGNSVYTEYLMMENDGNAPIEPFANATPATVAQQAGASTWLSYVGHGYVTNWGAGLEFGPADVALTQAASGLPVVFAAGCGTALFMPNTPWSGFSGDVTSIDVNGVTRGPFNVNPICQPGLPGWVITDAATGDTWGTGTPGPEQAYAPLPVATPSPNVFNIPIDCCAHQWLFDAAPGGAIVYIGDHCVAPDTYPVEIQNHLLNAYKAARTAPVLGVLFLTAQREYWAGPHSKDATTAGLSDYHGIPRLYLGWLVYFGDPSLRVPVIPG